MGKALAQGLRGCWPSTALPSLQSPRGAPPAVAACTAASNIAEYPGSGPKMDEDGGGGSGSSSNKPRGESVAEGQEAERLDGEPKLL